MQKLIELIRGYTPLSEKSIEALQGSVLIEKTEKNHYLLKEGQVCSRVWFIDQGMVRKFYIDEKGNEITTWIHCENEMVTSLNSYFQQIPSKEYIQTSEQCLIYSLPIEGSKELASFQQLADFSRRYLEDKFSCIDEISKKFSLMSAKEKYETLHQIAPEMVKRAKLGHIASIMGVKQETLSRIRTKRKSK